MFDILDYDILYKICFTKDYTGYNPNKIESPGGDGNWDDKKRYAHVATKYLETSNIPPEHKIILKQVLRTAWKKAMVVAIELDIPRKFWPVYENGALRILEYPPGAITHPHTDPDLFTLMCYRDVKESFKRLDTSSNIELLDSLNYQAHFGEMAEMITPKYKAMAHEVVATEEPQHSIVYFAIPDHDVKLPGKEMTVKEFLDERVYKRGRKYL